jgi:F-box and leucine-rich repeat protein GRR1
VQAFLREDLIVFCREAPAGSFILLPTVRTYTHTRTEFNEHQRDVFCVFSGVGVQRLRNYLNADSPGAPRATVFDADGTMYDESEEPEMILNVTAQANGMAIEEMDEDFGNESEMMGQD